MKDTQTADQQLTVESIQPIINDFSIKVATVNGSGSQTSNLAIMRALYNMGITVNSKNLFPSNISGLPTSFIIRANHEGYTAHSATVEILIAMNAVTIQDDLAELAPGGVFFYDDHISFEQTRTDVIYYPMPVKQIVREIKPRRGLRGYIANMVYVGVVAQMLGIELKEIRAALEKHFQKNPGPVKMNMAAIESAASWAAANLTKQDAFQFERSNLTEDMLVIDGNTAAALGTIYGGVGFCAWYPITPASSLAESLTEYLPILRTDPETGKALYAIIQTEDELAAAGMIIGAAWAGTRSMTSTSGPGLSLMAEFSGLAFFAEIPVVIWNVQRMGPSTGMPTRTSQGDLLFTRFLGHGDTRQVILLPGTIAECFEFAWKAFDIAERLQTPVFPMIDLDMGMNVWLSDSFKYPDTPMDRGKVLTFEELDKIEEYGRYRDIDGDGITYRTLPGISHPRGAWFARGTGHDEYARYSEKPEDWVANMERIWRKLELAVDLVPEPIIRKVAGAEIGVIAYGSTDPAVREACDKLADTLPVDYLRLRAVPFNADVTRFIEEHERVFVIEMNVDGQMCQLLQLDYPQYATRLHSLTLNNGLPLTPTWVRQALLAEEQK